MRDENASDLIERDAREAFPEDGDGPLVITDPTEIQAFRLLALKGMLKLEVVLGFKGRAYAQVKKEFGLKGSKSSVLIQFEAILRKRGILAS